MAGDASCPSGHQENPFARNVPRVSVDGYFRRVRSSFTFRSIRSRTSRNPSGGSSFGSGMPQSSRCFAFTIGHSITLSLAALDIVNLPGWLIEPAIALSIVVVGADNLLQRKEQGRDLRAWVAGAFGLIHGFGFPSVLREFGLPQEALGWSLFSFNVGVELGQLAIVLVVASALAFVRRRWPKTDKAIVVGGSAAVIAAGGYWFVERVFFGG